MAGFPPKKANVKPNIPSYDCPPVSTGNGGLAKSLKLKNAGTKNAPGNEKTVNLF